MRDQRDRMNGIARACVFVVLLIALFATLAWAQEELPEDIYEGLTNMLAYVEALLLVLLYVFVIALIFIQETRAAGIVKTGKSILANKMFWAFELLCGFLVLSLPFLSQPLGISAKASKLVFLIGGIGAFLPLAVLLIAAFISNAYRRGMLKLVSSGVLWGVFASGVALSMNFIYSRSIGTFVGYSYADAVLALILAPIFEEFVKGWGVIVLKHKEGFGSARVGMLYGFCIGIGFSAMESWLYFTAVASPFALGISQWVHVLVYRAVFSTLGHGYFTSALGASLGNAKQNNMVSRTAIGLFYAAALHSLFNMMFIVPELMPFRENYMLLLTLGFIYLLFKK